MKQGIGRLIRCETDHGKVIVLDSRFHRLKDKFIDQKDKKIVTPDKTDDLKKQKQTVFADNE